MVAWSHCIARMTDDKQLLFNTINGTGRRGRPVKSWNVCIREDLNSMGLTCHWWRKGSHAQPCVYQTVHFAFHPPLLFFPFRLPPPPAPQRRPGCGRAAPPQTDHKSTNSKGKQGKYIEIKYICKKRCLLQRSSHTKSILVVLRHTSLLNIKP